MRKHSPYFIAAAVLLVVFFAKTILADAESNTEDLEQLLPVSNQVLVSNKTVILKHSGLYESYNSEEDFQAMGIKLSRHLDLPDALTQFDNNKHPVYETIKDTSNGLQISLRLTGLDDDRSTYLVLTIKADNDEAITKIVQTKQTMDTKLRSLGASVKWNTLIQGELNTDYQQDHKKIWSLLNAQLKSDELERYHDKNTVSVSFYSSKLNAAIQSGDRTMNLQVALHRNSVTDQWRLTIGTPIITIEY